MTYRLTVNGHDSRGRGPRHAPAARRAARGPRPDRHEGGLRRGRVRRVHGPRRRRASSVSCLVPVCQVDGRAVRTVEGLASADRAGRGRSAARLAPLQQAFLETGGAQCGICTPGMLMAGEAFLGIRRRADRRGDPRGDRRQPVPLHRLHEDRRGDRARRGMARRRHGGRPARPRPRRRGLTMPIEPPVVSPTSLAEAYAIVGDGTSSAARRRDGPARPARAARSASRRTGSSTCGGSTSSAGSRSATGRSSSAR